MRIDRGGTGDHPPYLWLIQTSFTEFVLRWTSWRSGVRSV